MYLSKSERQKITSFYNCEKLTDIDHYQVEPDTWVYLFCDSTNKNYVLISADYSDFDFNHFPHLLRFNNNEFHKIDFILQKEIKTLNSSETANTVLFEYSK